MARIGGVVIEGKGSERENICYRKEEGRGRRLIPWNDIEEIKGSGGKGQGNEQRIFDDDDDESRARILRRIL